jgi:hypothetical protein
LLSSNAYIIEKYAFPYIIPFSSLIFQNNSS